MSLLGVHSFRCPSLLEGLPGASDCRQDHKPTGQGMRLAEGGGFAVSLCLSFFQAAFQEVGRRRGASKEVTLGFTKQNGHTEGLWTRQTRQHSASFSCTASGDGRGLWVSLDAQGTLSYPQRTAWDGSASSTSVALVKMIVGRQMPACHHREPGGRS